MNRWEGVGGLVRDPEFTYTPSGVAVWTGSIAVNGARWSKDAGGQVVTTVYVSLSTIGWLAEDLLERRLEQGDEVHVVGELAQYEIEGKDGKKDRKTRVTPWVVTVVRRRRPRPADRVHQEPKQRRGEDPWQPPETPPFDDEPPF